MKAITLWQPWASLIAEGVKTIETRPKCSPWSSAIGQTIAIHAAKLPIAVEDVMRLPHSPAVQFHFAHRQWWYSCGDNPAQHPVPLGAVVATCTLVDVVPMVSGDYGGDATKHLYLGEPSGNLVMFTRTEPPHVGGRWRNDDVTDQRPFGDFAPGRWALLLDNIVKLEHPIFDVGGFHRGVWTLPAGVEAQIAAQSAA